VEDETRNAGLHGNRNPERWGDFSQLQIQIQQTSHSEFVPRDTSEFKSNQNLKSKKFYFLDFDELTKISPPFRISITI